MMLATREMPLYDGKRFCLGAVKRHMKTKHALTMFEGLHVGLKIIEVKHVSYYFMVGLMSLVSHGK